MEIIDKNILVTGGTGFIGSHLVEKLVDLGIRPFVIDIINNKDNYFSSCKLSNKTKFIITDINNFSQLSLLFRKYHIQIIYHLAAQSLVEDAYVNPLTTLQSNIMGTVNILEAARKTSSVQAIVVASSDKAYGKKGNIKYKESNSLKGDHPYEVSKTCADLIAQTYIKTYDMPICITRFGNVYGEGDLNFSRIIPGIMKAIIYKETLKIRSNGKFIRDYIYVKDVINGYLSIIKYWHNTKHEAFNFGSKETLSVLDLIKLVEKTLQLKVKCRILNTAQNEIPYQSLNCTKIKHLTGWQPHYSLSQTSSQIFKWYQKYFHLQEGHLRKTL